MLISSNLSFGLRKYVSSLIIKKGNLKLFQHSLYQNPYLQQFKNKCSIMSKFNILDTLYINTSNFKENPRLVMIMEYTMEEVTSVLENNDVKNTIAY